MAEPLSTARYGIRDKREMADRMWPGWRDRLGTANFSDLVHDARCEVAADLERFCAIQRLSEDVEGTELKVLLALARELRG